MGDPTGRAVDFTRRHTFWVVHASVCEASMAFGSMPNFTKSFLFRPASLNWSSQPHQEVDGPYSAYTSLLLKPSLTLPLWKERTGRLVLRLIYYWTVVSCALWKN